MTGCEIFLVIYASQSPLGHDGDEDGLKVLIFHLEAPCRRPIARRAGGRVSAHTPPHPGRGKRISRELRDGRVLVHYLRRGK